ncbi:MAG: DUF2179 domain-containing protein [Fibrobacter sp.]|nr:DUF2179 domain-containing protein [Fibrobacter sp.]
MIILVAKMTEVSIGTLRHILITKGYRKLGASLSFLEITLWIFVASRVIIGIAEAPIKGIIYSLGYAVGVYIGSRIESRIALGRVLIQVIVEENIGHSMLTSLRENGYGVTSVNANGRHSNKLMLIIYANRLKKEKIIDLIHKVDQKALVVISHVDVLKGGYYPSWRRLGK